MLSITPSHFHFRVALMLCLLSNNVFAGQTTRVNVSNSGKQAISYTGGTEQDRYSRISADGRYVVFSSFAANLADDRPHDPELVTHTYVYVRDLSAQKTELVSFPLDDNHYISSEPNISADGQYVVFITDKIVNNESFNDIYIHDRLTHKTELLNVGHKGDKSNRVYAQPSFSANDRYLVFISYDSNLVLNDNNNNWDVFVYDLLTHKIEQVSVSSKGVQGNNQSSAPVISAEGRYVVFHSNASNLVANDTNNGWDIFIHDRLTHKTERVSLASNGAQAQIPSQTSGSNFPCISADGRYIAFDSDATNLAVNDTNNAEDIFLHDRLTRKTERVSFNVIGKPNKNKSMYCSISADGRHVAYISKYTEYGADVFVHDRLTHKTEKINVKSNGALAQQNYLSSRRRVNISMSADGRHVSFDSSANNLVPHDTNDDYDIFVRDRLLDTNHHADLSIAATKQSASVKPNKIGTYLYTITNNGKDTVSDVSLIHLVSGGSAVSFKPSQGKCSLSPAETICHLGQLPAGKKITVHVTVKAQSKAINQQVTVSGAPVDTKPINNQVSVATPIK